MPRITAAQAGGQNICAFLDLLAFGEIGPGLLATSDDGYNLLVGSIVGSPKFFYSYAMHPDIYNAALDSTAAGRYQILYRWWPSYQARLKLPDFTPLSQDLYALEILREQQAWQPILNGQIPLAIQRVNDIWASLPGSPYGQRTAKSPALNDFLHAYQNAGGTLA